METRLAKSLCLIALAGSCLAAQTPDYAELRARPSPKWLHEAVIYEINPRAFSAQGNFDGITARLDELKQLGVTLLWLMPIHPPGKLKSKGTLGSPYAVRDYYAFNPDYGTGADFRRLVNEAHKRGLKVIIDIVANHTAWDSVWMKDKTWYKRDSAGNVLPPQPDWSDVAALDYSNPKVDEAMAGVLEWWLREYDLDGFRCDAAGMVPTGFWEMARPRLDRVKKDMVMLAEWSAPDLLVKAFDLDYAWPFHSALTDVFENGKPARTLREVWVKERARFPRGAMHMMFSDNHDEKRAIARFGERGALAASALVFTLDGVPMLYNGMEVGDTTESGAPALFEKLPVFWPIAERRPEFRRIYEQMIRVRHEHAALEGGEVRWVGNSDEDRVLTFLRRGAGEEVLVAVNASNRPFEGNVAIESAQDFRLLVQTDGANLPAIKLEAWGWRLYRRPLR
jgi:glycosidase